jgi:hypothetical protein
MNVFIIIALVCIVAMAWFWLKKPALKGVPARTWPASRGKLGAKPKLT